MSSGLNDAASISEGLDFLVAQVWMFLDSLEER